MRSKIKYRIIISAVAALALIISGSIIVKKDFFKPKVTISIGNWPKGSDPETIE